MVDVGAGCIDAATVVVAVVTIEETVGDITIVEVCTATIIV